MGSTKEDQTARRKAIQDTIAENRPFFEERMRHYYEAMGLGEWKPRLSAEERAAKKAADEKAANVAKIRAMAEKAGIGVLLVEDPDIQQKLDSAADGTFQGVSFDWRGDEDGWKDEPGSPAAEARAERLVETTQERAERIAAEAEAAEAEPEQTA